MVTKLGRYKMPAVVYAPPPYPAPKLHHVVEILPMEAATLPERKALAEKQIRAWMTESAPDHLAFYKVWKRLCV